MRLRLADLEAARRDPRSFRLGAPTTRPFRGGISKTRTLHLAIFDFHRRGDDLSSASEHLRNLYHRNFKREDRLPQLEEQLEAYAAAYHRLGNVPVQAPLRVRILARQGLVLTGEVPRLDLDASGGYAAWLFVQAPGSWRDELRMPLLQAHFAETLGVALDQVTVGVYELETTRYDCERFPNSVVERAKEELNDLAEIFSSPE